MSAPPELLCPITKTLMRDPVLITCGHAFERSAIAAWFLKEDFCPVCQKVLSVKELIPCQTLLRQLTNFQLGVLRELPPSTEPWFHQLMALVTREVRRYELQDMKAFLHEHKLDFYSETLIRNGFCSLTRLSKITRHEIDKLDIPPVDRVALLDAVSTHVLGTARRAEKGKKNAKPHHSRDLLQLKADVDRIETEYKHNSLELQQRQSRHVQMSKRNVINTIILRDEDIQFTPLELDAVKVHVTNSKQGPRETSRLNSSSALSVTPATPSAAATVATTATAITTTTAPT